MKVKILAYENTRILEKEINEFIKDKRVIDIKFNSYTLLGGSSPNLTHFVYDRVMVLYDEDNSTDVEKTCEQLGAVKLK